MAQLESVQVEFGASERQNRWSVAFRWILVIPHWFVLLALGIAAEVLVVLGWFAALVTGRFPPSFASFVSGVLQYQTRVSAYVWLMHDLFPPFSWSDPDPVHVFVPLSRVRRLAVLFRVILLLPAAIVTGVVNVGMSLSSFVIWLVVLVHGSMPPALFDAVAAVLRYQVRYSAYAFMLTAKYPGELFGDQPLGPPPPTGPTGAAVQWGARPGYAPPPPPAATEMTLQAPSAVPAAPLVLRRASKRILVVFVVLGVLGYGAVVGVDAVALTSTSSSQAFVDAHTTLQNQLNAAEGQRASCALGQVPCLDQFWTQLSSDFGQFGTSLSGISVPASAQADKTKLQTDTSALGTLLQQLSSEDPSSISQAQLGQLQSLSTGFDADSVRLADDLS